tara:strand:+ start:507 stop:704 length:198 start_codon:yes stop_codon:yes gene_type:complete
MQVGDLVKIKQLDYSPFYDRPSTGEVGIILEVQHNSFLGITYYVQTTAGILRFADYELELINESG